MRRWKTAPCWWNGRSARPCRKVCACAWTPKAPAAAPCCKGRPAGECWRTPMSEAFLAQAGWGDAVPAPLPGDASTRSYVRLTRRGESAMLMRQPQSAETPAAAAHAGEAERRALGYNAVARLAGA